MLVNLLNTKKSKTNKPVLLCFTQHFPNVLDHRTPLKDIFTTEILWEMMLNDASSCRFLFLFFNTRKSFLI